MTNAARGVISDMRAQRTWFYYLHLRLAAAGPGANGGKPGADVRRCPRARLPQNLR
jgi:hypothetical protein